MNSVLVVHNGTKWPDYFVYCPNCGFGYKTFSETHFCKPRGARFNIDDEVVIDEQL